MLRILFIALFLPSIITLSFAQDSVKQVAPAKPYKPAVKQVTPNKVYKYNPVKPAPTVVKPAYQPAVSVKRDSLAAVAPPVVIDKSLNGQYQYLLTKVYHYQQPLIATLWKSASDTLVATRHKLMDAAKNVSFQKKAIDSLKADLASKDQSLSATTSKVDEVDVLGIPLSKTAYNMITWGLVLVFGITAAVVIIQSGSYGREAKYRIKLYNELEEEFKTYKTKANEKEKKLARELQTERNKLDELLGRG